MNCAPGSGELTVNYEPTDSKPHVPIGPLCSTTLIPKCKQSIRFLSSESEGPRGLGTGRTARCEPSTDRRPHDRQRGADLGRALADVDGSDAEGGIGTALRLPRASVLH